MRKSNDKVSRKKSYIKSVLLFLCVIFLILLLLYTTTNIIIPSIIIALCLIYCISNVYLQTSRWLKKRTFVTTHRERFLKLLLSLMSLFFFVNMALYIRVLYLLGKHYELELVNAELFIRAAADALNLFFFNINGVLLNNLGNYPNLRGLVSIMALLSFSCTIAVLINLAYSRFKSYIKISYQTRVDGNHNHLYMFVGFDESSLLLSQSIKKRDGDKSIILAIDQIKGKDDDEPGWNSIVDFFTIRKKTYSDIEKVNARIAFIDTPLYDIKLRNDDNIDIFELINLPKVCKLIDNLGKYKDSELHIFMLSDNENENMRTMTVLAHDTTINKIKTKIKTLRFYYHARKSELNSVIDDVALRHQFDIRAVDSAYLTVQQLKLNEDYHPVRLMDIDEENPTTIKSEFNSLIIGFSEIGQDSLRFLYEYAAFVSNVSTVDNVVRSPFKCTAIDNNMRNLNGRFSEFISNLKTYSDKNCPIIKLIQCDYNTTGFYENILKPDVQKLNYIIVALGDDDKSMECAIVIFNYIRKYRQDLSNLRIFVRSYDHEKEKLVQNIADHYNEGYNMDYKEEYKDKKHKDFKIIVPFGKMEDIYSYDMIIDDKLIEYGKIFQKRYAEMSDDKNLWDKRRNLKLGFIDKDGNKISKENQKVSLKNIRELRRKEYQDVSNAFHMNTKLYLLKHALDNNGKFDWKFFFHNYFMSDGIHVNKTGCRDSIVYPYLSEKENNILLNLACLEHERWIAAHQLLGYTASEADDPSKKEHECNEIKMQHNCLIPWQKLDEESELSSTLTWTCDYKIYDFGVVDVTIQLGKDKLLN